MIKREGALEGKIKPQLIETVAFVVVM